MMRFAAYSFCIGLLIQTILPAGAATLLTLNSVATLTFNQVGPAGAQEVIFDIPSGLDSPPSIGVFGSNLPDGTIIDFANPTVDDIRIDWILGAAGHSRLAFTGTGEIHVFVFIDPMSADLFSPGSTVDVDLRGSLASGIPEASTWLMLLIGFAMLGIYRQRQQRSIAQGVSA